MHVLTLADWLRGASPEERDMLAGTVGTSVNYLYHLAGKHGRPSLRLAGRIAETTRAFAEEPDPIGPGSVPLYCFYDD
jgi:hypothetical protein